MEQCEPCHAKGWEVQPYHTRAVVTKQSWCSGLKHELRRFSKEKGTIKGPTFQKSLSPQVAGFFSASGHGFALGNCSIMQKAVKERWRCREWTFLLPCLAGVSEPKARLKKYFAQSMCNGLVKQAFIIDSLHHATRSPSRWRNHFPSCLMLLFYAVVRNWLIATLDSHGNQSSNTWKAKACSISNVQRSSHGSSSFFSSM